MKWVNKLEELLRDWHGEIDLSDVKVSKDWQGYPWCWSGYGPRKDCLLLKESGPFWNEESVEVGIICMFGAVLDVVVDALGYGRWIVQPSCEERSFMMIVDRAVVLWQDQIKTWQFEFAKPEELEEFIEDVYATCRRTKVEA